MEAEVRELLELFELRLTEYIHSTEEYKRKKAQDDGRGFWFNFKVGYGLFRKVHFHYEEGTSHFTDLPYRNLKISKDNSDFDKVSEARGKLLKIICQHGDKIQENFLKDFNNDIYWQRQSMREYVEKQNKREAKRKEKEKKQMKVCKVNLEKTLGRVQK